MKLWHLTILNILGLTVTCHEFNIMYSYDQITQNPYVRDGVFKFVWKIKSLYEKNFYQEDNIREKLKLTNTMNSCMLDFAKITESVIEGKTWPWKFLDASGKLPPGMTGGDLTWIGSFEECNQIVGDYNSSIGTPIRGRYCNIRIPITMDDPDVAIDIGITIGICLPSDCTTSDLQWISERMFGAIKVQIDERYTFCHQRKEELPHDKFYTFAIIVASTVLALVVCGSVLDTVLYCVWRSALLKSIKYQLAASEPDAVESMASSTEPSSPIEAEHNLINYPPGLHLTFIDYRKNFFERYCVCGAFLLVFSFPYNLWKLWQARPQEIVDSDGTTRAHPLACLDGIRVITLSWIIYVHNFTYQTYYVNNALLYKAKAVHDWGYQLVRNGSFSVDTFFLISGLLACYILIPGEKRVRGCLRKLLFWLHFVFHRFIRIAPSWFFVTILFTGLFPYLTDGPMYPQNADANDELRGCRNHWWITFFNTFFYTDRPCMLWTWYLSNDFQFSVVLTPIFITLLALHRAAGVIFAVCLIISSTIATFVITYMNEYGPAPIPLLSFGRLYVKPYTRWGPYAIGMLLGWLLHEYPVDARKHSFRKRFCITTLASVSAAVLTLLVLFGLYPYMSGELPPMSNTLASIYAALSRPVWTLGIATAIYLCAIQFSPIVNAILSFSGFSVFSKLNYCAYLVHPILIMYHQQSLKRTESFDAHYLLFSYASIWILSYLVALVISLTTEYPILVLGKMLNRNNRA